MEVAVQDTTEVDIYADLPNFKYDETLDKIKKSEAQLQYANGRLKVLVEEKTREIEQLKSKVYNLELNISSLLKTARLEIGRKDRTIAELRTQAVGCRTRVVSTSPRTKLSNHRERIKRDGTPRKIIEKANLARINLPDASSEAKTIASDTSQIPEEKSSEATQKEPQLASTEKTVQIHTLYSARALQKIKAINAQNEEVRTKALGGSHSEECLASKDVLPGGKPNRGSSPATQLERLNEPTQTVKTSDKSHFTRLRSRSKSQVNVSPISSSWIQKSTARPGENASDGSKKNDESPNATHSPSKNNKSSVIDLFGSPLKWSENSSDVVSFDITSPAVFEDSVMTQVDCSVNLNSTALLPKSTGHPELPNTDAQPELSKPSFLHNETTNFESTTQFVAALTKPYAQISPLKSSRSSFSTIQSEKVTSSCVQHEPLTNGLTRQEGTLQSDSPLNKLSSRIPSAKSPDSSELSPRKDAKAAPKKSKDLSAESNKHEREGERVKEPKRSLEALSVFHLNSQKCVDIFSKNRTSKRDFSDKPINVLQPRKTPRIVESKMSSSSPTMPSQSPCPVSIIPLKPVARTSNFKQSSALKNLPKAADGSGDQRTRWEVMKDLFHLAKGEEVGERNSSQNTKSEKRKLPSEPGGGCRSDGEPASKKPFVTVKSTESWQVSRRTEEPETSLPSTKLFVRPRKTEKPLVTVKSTESWQVSRRTEEPETSLPSTKLFVRPRKTVQLQSMTPTSTVHITYANESKSPDFNSKVNNSVNLNVSCQKTSHQSTDAVAPSHNSHQSSSMARSKLCLSRPNDERHFPPAMTLISTMKKRKVSLSCVTQFTPHKVFVYGKDS